MQLELAADVTGAGPPLVILHGLFGSKRNWSGIARALSATHAVHTLDLRNHGHSPWADVMDIPAMAGDVGGYLDRNGIAPAAVMGHSLGGKVAAWLALTRPAAVGRLIAVDVAPVAYDHEFRGFLAAMRAVPVDRLRRRAEAEAHLATAIPDPAVRAFLAHNLAAEDGRLRWRPNLAAIEASLDAITGFPEVARGGRFPGPALFLRGEVSKYVLPAHEPVIERLFPNARIDTVPGAGHWVHVDAPDAFLERVRRFLAEG